MKYLFDFPDQIARLAKKDRIFLFLDYDGTLAPIADRPEKALMAPKTRAVLSRISLDPRFKLAIITGRSLKDIKKLVAIKDIIYAGNHGLEIEGPKLRFKPVVAAGYRELIGRIKEDLRGKTAGIKGVFIEDKGLSLSFHYRLVDKKEVAKAKTIFHEAVIVHLVRNKIKIKTGKMVLEVSPPVAWDKGKIVLWLLARQLFKRFGKEAFPVYIGDDVTDEDAFKALRHRGLTVFVGEPKESGALYYVKDCREVVKFLEMISQPVQER